MGRLFLHIYTATRAHRRIWLALFLVLFCAFSWTAFSLLHIEEDITKTFPRTEEFKKYDNLYRNSSISGNIIVAIGPLNENDPEAPIEVGEQLVEAFELLDTGLIKNIRFRSEASDLERSYANYLADLPYFLTATEVDTLFNDLSHGGIVKRLTSTLNRLRSYESMGTKKFLMTDPLQLGSPILQRLSRLQEGNALRIENGYMFNPSGEYLLMIVAPTHPPSETIENTRLVEGLQHAIDSVRTNGCVDEVLLFGGPVIAVENAQLLHRDTRSVGILAGAGILLLLWAYFRKLSIPILFFLPALFGLMFALAIMAITKGTISAISVAVGTIVLGIAIDYSFHFFNHYRETGSVERTLSDIASPMLLGCTTTVLAFFSLNFLHSEVLADFGTFAGLSLLGTAFFALLALPHVAWWAKFRPLTEPTAPTALPFKWKAMAFFSLILITVFLWNHADEVQFEDDLNKINYFPEHLQRAQQIIVGNGQQENLFVLSENQELTKAIEQTGQLRKAISETTHAAELPDSALRATVLTDVIPTPDQAAKSVARWNRHVAELSGTIESDLLDHASELGFQPDLLAGYMTIFRSFPEPDESFYRKLLLEDALYREFVFMGDNGYNVVSTVNMPRQVRPLFEERLQQLTGLELIAVSSLAHDLIETVGNDLNFLLILSSALVFAVLLLTYGRIELALITFLPMAVSWVWILGICGLFNIKFNMINVVVTTFIFGLGDDYSIFVSDGILSRFKYGVDKLRSYRSSIILSAITTIIGTGALIISKHPALHSIALLSVVGMICVVIASLTLQPLLYDLLLESRKKRGFSPLELRDLFRAALAFGWFFIGCLLLTLLLLLMIPIPVSKRKKQRWMMSLISLAIRSDYQIMTHVKTRWIDKDPLDRPAILIANHASFVDLMVMIGSSNKLLLVTNDWVWNSPFFGAFIRYVEYIHAKDETSWDLEKIRQKVDEGYSILIFPEGTRSRDGRIGRFKKGAFYLAEQLQIDILPVVLHGIHHALRKGDFSVQKSIMTIKYLPRISPDDPAFGIGYRERTKRISRYFKDEFRKVQMEIETAGFYADKVQRLYTYKGPVLEWYVRVKMKLENNFEDIVSRVPRAGKVYDLGCGYGYLSHLLAMQSFERQVIGLDYDEEKVQVAANTHYQGGNLLFQTMDLTQFEPESADCFIIKDVLHYFPAEQQEALLQRCGEKLNAGGVIIIRDGIEDEQHKHGVTKLTEVFSTKLLGFNKVEYELEFLPESRILSFAERNNLSVERLENNASSNITFVLRPIGP